MDITEGYLPAAALIVMRDQPDGPPELLMTERSSALVFAGGTLVFPGGRIDPADWTVARTAGLLVSGEAAADAPARVAAIRETLEEATVAVAFDPAPLPQEASAIAEALRGGMDFASVLAQGGFRLDLARLTAWARLRPALDMPSPRHFDTRFYLAPAPAHAEPIADGRENLRVLWMSASDVLAAADRAEHDLHRATRRNLLALAEHGSVADACGRIAWEWIG